MRQVYDFTDPNDCAAAASVLERVSAEAWGILRQIGERYTDARVSELKGEGSLELKIAQAQGRGEGIRLLFSDVQQIVKRGHAAVAELRHQEQAEAKPARATVVAMPGRGSL